MERMIIQVLGKKSKLVKSLLKELGVIVEPDVFVLSEELDKMVQKGRKPALKEILNEIRETRTELNIR